MERNDIMRVLYRYEESIRLLATYDTHTEFGEYPDLDFVRRKLDADREALADVIMAAKS